MKWLHHDATAEDLGLVRIATFAIWFVVIARLPIQSLSELPTELINPPAIGEFLPWEALAASPLLLLALKLATLLGCLLCVAGARPFMPIAVATVLLILFHDVAAKSVGGFVNHAQFGPLYVAMVLAISPSAQGLAVSRPRLRVGGARMAPHQDVTFAFPLQACALVLTTAYAFLGLRRLVQGGASLFRSDSLDLWVVARSLEAGDYGFQAGLLVLDVPLLSAVVGLGFFVATVFEALSPLALRFARFRVAWVAVMVGLHFSTLVMMNIFFWENLVLILVLMTPMRWARVRTGSVLARQERTPT